MQRCLTPRPSGAPTASHKARSVGTRHIFASPGPAPCHGRRLSSNVRHAIEDTDINQHGSPRGVATRSQFMPAVPNQPMLPSPNCGSATRGVLLGPRERGPDHQRARIHRTSTHCARRLRAPRLNCVAVGPNSQRGGEMPDPSVKLTRYGSPRLAAPGTNAIMPPAAKPRPPAQAAYLKR